MAPRSAGLPAPLKARRTADRAVRGVRRTKVKLSSLNASVGFPYRRPDRPPRASSCLREADARRRLRHRVGQAPAGPRRPVDHHQRPAAAGRADAGVAGDPGRRSSGRPPGARHVEEGRLAARRHLHPQPPQPPRHAPAITAIPEPWRGHLVVGAAADYFFTSHLTSAASALVLNAFPVARNVAGRQSADLARELIEDGWSLVIFPEGGRSPDGWGQPFKGGAAYLSSGPARPSCRCSSRAPAPSWARA